MALFGSLFSKKPAAPIYVLMDSDSRLLARARLKSAPGGGELVFQVIDGDEGRLYDADVVQAVPQDKSVPVRMTRMVRARDGLVTLSPMRELGSDVRRNFRVPLRFESYAYPTRWTKTPIISVDLSCGGVAFTSVYPFAVGDEVQLVVPVTREAPLLLCAEALRVRPEPGRSFVACKFVDMIDDEETMLREAVFATQISSARARR